MPEERHVFIDKNWESGKSFLDPDSDYWKQPRSNVDMEDTRRWNEAMRAGNGKIVRRATTEELNELKMP